MRSGRPAPGVLATLARYHPDARVRNQLLVARNEADFGGGVAGGLLKSGLIGEPVAKALAQLELNADQGWLLGQVAESKLQDLQHQQRMKTTLFVPVMVSLFGLVALLVGFAMMSTLVSLIF
jgi:type II secretory pathway component PulF